MVAIISAEPTAVVVARHNGKYIMSQQQKVNNIKFKKHM